MTTPTEPTIPTQMTIKPLEALETTPSMGRKEKALQGAGATREVAYKAMVDGLSAMTMTLDKFGDEHFAEDHTARLKSAELISKLNGDLKESAVTDNRSVTINIGAEGLSALVEVVKDMNMQLAMLKSSGQQTGEIIDVETI